MFRPSKCPMHLLVSHLLTPKLIAGTPARCCLHSLAIRGSKMVLKPLLQLNQPSVTNNTIRCLGSVKLSQHLEYFSASSELTMPAQGSMCVSGASDGARPLVLLMVWLMSKDVHIQKYVKFYNSLGVDVLKVRISPLETLNPTKGSQVVAGKFLEFLHKNPSQTPIVVHGFSVGCYLFCEGLVQIDRNFTQHGHLLDRFVGQIWDSGVDIYAIPDGLSKIARSKASQKLIKHYVEWYLRFRYDSATVHYERASKMLNEAYLKKPGLFLFSDNDSISTPDMNAFVLNNWTKMGVPVYSKCFTGSPHVGHFFRHPSAYKEEVTNFLHTVGFLRLHEKHEATA